MNQDTTRDSGAHDFALITETLVGDARVFARVEEVVELQRRLRASTEGLNALRGHRTPKPMQGRGRGPYPGGSQPMPELGEDNVRHWHFTMFHLSAIHWVGASYIDVRAAGGADREALQQVYLGDSYGMAETRLKATVGLYKLLLPKFATLRAFLVREGQFAAFLPPGMADPVPHLHPGGHVTMNRSCHGPAPGPVFAPPAPNGTRPGRSPR